MYGEAEIEASEQALANEREREIARIRGGLSAPGAQDCQNCLAAIPEARRVALPSATRCAPCQTLLERGHG